MNYIITPVGAVTRSESYAIVWSPVSRRVQLPLGEAEKLSSGCPIKGVQQWHVSARSPDSHLLHDVVYF